MNFVTIDFETANSERRSICQLGMVRVVDGQPVERFKSFVKPEPFKFDFWNVRIHGIGESHVVDAPTFVEVYPTLQSWLEGQLVVAHNASFDMGALREACASYGLTPFPMHYICTMRMAKSLYGAVQSAALPSLCQRFGFAINHHDALEDAFATHQVAMRLLAEAGVTSNAEISERFAPLYYRHIEEKKPAIRNRKPAVPVISASDGPLLGKAFVFTGTLETMVRQKASEAAAELGATISNSVGKKTDYLVLGHLDAPSTKLKAARQLQSEGHHIEVITEEDFSDMLDTS